MCAVSNSGFQTQFMRDIDGVNTEFVFHDFANKWFLLISQYEKMANIYSVEFDVKGDDAISPLLRGPVYDPLMHVSVPVTLKCNFGADKDETRSAIQFLVNRSKLNRCATRMVISLGLKKIDGNILREVANVLDEIIK